MAMKESITDLSLVSRCKRRKQDDRNEESESEPLHEYEFINNKLPDAMLLEILYRLPCRYAVQYKSVSKHWLSLISDPYFIRGFIHHRHQLFGNDCYYSSHSQSCSFTHVLQYPTKSDNPNEDDIRVLSSDNSSLFKSDRKGLDFLNFLPVVRLKYPTHIEASFDDLLLVCSQVPTNRMEQKSGFYEEYYICNPLTKEWLKLPHLPSNNNAAIVMVGFVCLPNSCDNEQGCINNAHYRFRVVRIRCLHTESSTTQTRLQVQIFSSETNEWSNSVLSSPRGLNLNPFLSMSCRSGVIACNGMLHWVWVEGEGENQTIKGFVVFDPFHSSEQCHYIDPPIDLSPQHSEISFGSFQKRLRIFQKSRYSLDDAGSYTIWELKDYSNSGTWCMKHKLHFKDIVLEEFGDPFKTPGRLKLLFPFVIFLAFHPDDSEIVFLRYALQYRRVNYILSCNMRTRVLKLVNNDKRIRPIPATSVFLLVQLVWPTPVPPLPLNALPISNSKLDCIGLRDL